MEGYMYAIFKNHGRALLGYLNFGMEKKGPTKREAIKAAEIYLEDMNLDAKRMTQMTARDVELITDAECLTMDRAGEIDKMVDRCDTCEAAVRLDSIRMRLTQLAKGKR